MKSVLGVPTPVRKCLMSHEMKGRDLCPSYQNPEIAPWVEAAREFEGGLLAPGD